MEPRLCDTGKTLRPAPTSASDPLAGSSLVLQDQLGAMFWKKTHFRGLSPQLLGRARWREIEALLTAEWMSSLLRAKIDPLDALFTLFTDGVQNEADQRGCDVNQWQHTETSLTTRLMLALVLADRGSVGKCFEYLTDARVKARSLATATLMQPDPATRLDFLYG